MTDDSGTPAPVGSRLDGGVGRLEPERDGLTLSGDDNTPAMPMTEAEVNHLRRLLAWLRCEYTLDEHMQRGFLMGAASAVQHGVDPALASAVVQKKAEQINRCPAYVRQAHKMLDKALRAHERKAGIVEGHETPNVGGEARLAAHQPPHTTTATPQGVASTDQLGGRVRSEKD